jgi:hypothetical protein
VTLLGGEGAVSFQQAWLPLIFWWYLGLNSGPCTCWGWACVLPLEAWPQLFVALFLFFWTGSWIFALAWP